MSSIKVRPLQDDLPFGARISGVTWANIEDAAVRKQINDVFEERGMIVFEDVEPSSKMQVAVSTNTELVVIRDGKCVRVKPGSEQKPK